MSAPQPLNNRRTSFNVGHLGNTAAFIRFMEDYRPSSVVINDDIKLATDVYNATEGETMVVHRLVTKFDGVHWRKSDSHYMKPVDYVNYVIAGSPDKNIWKYVLNEPLAHGRDEIAERNNWIIEVGHELAT